LPTRASRHLARVAVGLKLADDLSQVGRILAGGRGVDGRQA